MSIDPEELEQDDPKGLRNAVERANAAAAESQAKLEALERREAFRDAGLNPADKLHAAVIDGYSGDIAGVKDFVTGLGLDQPAPTSGITAEEQAAMNRMAGISTGDGQGAPGDPDADGNARLKGVVDRAIHEGWAQTKFNDEYRAEMQRQGRLVAQLEVQGPPR